ncbi:MAG: hypothetical protein V9E94_06815 [Microthrixaceae bacterium]
MRVDVLTIFPEMVDGFAKQSLLGKARRAGKLDLRVHDLRDATTDVHRSVDDSPFGGGAGMVLAPGPIFATVERESPPRPLFLLGPGRAPTRPGTRSRSSPRATASRCSAGATRASTHAFGNTSSTGSCRSVTTCSPAARSRRWWCSRLSVGSCRG